MRTLIGIIAVLCMVCGVACDEATKTPHLSRLDTSSRDSIILTLDNMTAHMSEAEKQDFMRVYSNYCMNMLRNGKTMDDVRTFFNGKSVDEILSLNTDSVK